MEKKNNNYFDLIFCHNEKFVSKTDEKGCVTIYVENRGPFNFVMQKLFGKPRVSQFHLEEFGSFIWSLIDGKTTVNQIAEKVKRNFGEKSEPLYPRLLQYFKTLNYYDFIKKINTSK